MLLCKALQVCYFLEPIMNYTTILHFMAGLFALMTSQVALAQSPAKVPKTGEQVYNQTCMACHASGVANAPKFKDVAAWKPLIAEGQHILSSHALVGVRAMPAKGGANELSVAEFSNAVAYMARNAGGDWKDVDAAMLGKIAKEGSKRLEVSMRQSAALKRELQKLIPAK
jgi:cytochrome c5